MTVNAYREKETAILKEQIDKLNSAIYKEEAKAKELEMKAKYVECNLVKNIFPLLNFEPTYHLLRKKLFSVIVFGDFQHPLFWHDLISKFGLLWQILLSIWWLGQRTLSVMYFLYGDYRLWDK